MSDYPYCADSCDYLCEVSKEKARCTGDEDGETPLFLVYNVKARRFERSKPCLDIDIDAEDT